MNTLADYYAKRAPEYERIYQKPERQADLSRLRAFVAASFAGRTVLEIACGTGYWTEVLASTARSVIATDLNETVLALARTKPLGDKVQLLPCDAFQLDRIAGQFDAALAVFWWSHLTRAQLTCFLDGLHRKLQPGSVVVFIDNIFVEGSSTPVSRRDAEGNTHQMRSLDDGSSTEVLKNFPTNEEIATALPGEAISIDRLTYYWSVRYGIRA